MAFGLMLNRITILLVLVVLVVSAANTDGHTVHKKPFHPLDVLQGFHTEHTGRHQHHKFNHLDAKTGGFVDFRYNVSKHPDHDLIQIKNAVSLRCITTDDVYITFMDADAKNHFLNKVYPGAIVMSHHELRCGEMGHSILTKLTKVEADVPNEKNDVHIVGNPISPLTLFEHADIEFTTSIVPTAHTVSHNSHSNKIRGRTMNPQWGISSFNPVKAAVSVAKSVANTATTVVKTVTNVISGDVAFNTDNTPNGWNLPIPSNFMDMAPEKLKMVCSECKFTIQPIVRFSIEIKGFKLSTMKIVVEGIAEFEAIPSIDITALEKEFEKNLAEVTFQSILLTIGGVPVELVPKFILDAKLSITITLKAKLGMKANFVGSLKAGVRFDQQNGLRSTWEAQYAKVPKGYSFQGSKTCQTFTGTPQSFKSINDCNDLCTKDSKCLGIRWKSGVGECTVTTACQSADVAAGDSLTFLKATDDEPLSTDAQVEAVVELFLIPTLQLVINRVGGPYVTMSFSVASTSTYGTDTKCIDTDVAGHVEAVIGAKISIELGPEKLYEKELGSQSVYSKDIPIGQYQKCFSSSTGSTPSSPSTPSTPVTPPPAGPSTPATPPPPPITCAPTPAPPGATPSPPTPAPATPTPATPAPPTATASAPTPATPSAPIVITRAPQCVTIFPKVPVNMTIGDSWIGMCDAETFRYRVQFRFVGGPNNQVVISQNIFDGETTCTVQGFYSVRSSKGDEVYLKRTPDEDVESDNCIYQAIPAEFTASFLYNGGGIWLYHKSNWCARTMLRVGSSIDTVNKGQAVYLEQLMSSSLQKLILQWDRNAVIYSYDTNGAIWASGTQGSSVGRMFLDNDGYLRLTSTTGSVVKTLNPNGPRGGQYVVLGDDCSLSIYASLPFLKPLWTLGTTCAKGDYVPSAPVKHRGGSFLYMGEVMYQNAGIYNANGFMEHGTDEINLYRWSANPISRVWTTNTKGYCTIVVTLQFDGEFILQDCNGAIVWKSGTWGKGATVARIESCGVALYKSFPNKDLVWKSSGSWDCPQVADVPSFPATPPESSPHPIGQMERAHFLLPGQSLLQTNAIIQHQIDGNVVMYQRDNAASIWSTNTAGKCGKAFTLQFDGNLVMYGCGGPDVFWSTDTHSSHPKILTFEPNCNLGLYMSVGKKNLVKSLNSKTCTATPSTWVNYPIPYGPRLAKGSWLYRGQAIYSMNAGLVHQMDGQVIYFTLNPTKKVWSTNTKGNCSLMFGLNDNGNMILKSCTNATLWEAKIGDKGATSINVQDTCFAADSSSNAHIWSSDSTNCPAYTDLVFTPPVSEVPPTLPPFPQQCTTFAPITIASPQKHFHALQSGSTCTLPPATPAAPPGANPAPATPGTPATPSPPGPVPAQPTPASPKSTPAPPVETWAPKETDPQEDFAGASDAMTCDNAKTIETQQLKANASTTGLSTACSAFVSGTDVTLEKDLLKCETDLCTCIGGTYSSSVKTVADFKCNGATPQCSDNVCVGIAVGCRFNTKLKTYALSPDCTADAEAMTAVPPETRIALCIARACRELPGCRSSQYTTMCPSSALSSIGGAMFGTLIALLVTIMFLF